MEFVPRLPAFAEKTSISERGFFWRKHARMQAKMCFPSHARHCFPSTAFSSFLRAPRGFRVRPRRRLFRVRIFQCRLCSTQASVFCPHSIFHASKYCLQECFGINSCLRTRSILNKIIELVREDAGVFLQSQRKTFEMLKTSASRSLADRWTSI